MSRAHCLKYYIYIHNNRPVEFVFLHFCVYVIYMWSQVADSVRDGNLVMFISMCFLGLVFIHAVFFEYSYTYIIYVHNSYTLHPYIDFSQALGVY